MLRPFRVFRREVPANHLIAIPPGWKEATVVIAPETRPALLPNDGLAGVVAADLASGGTITI
jgi:hypothetical protein